MNRRDFFHLQAVTEGELDAAFEGAEDAIWNLAADIGAFGIFSGLVAQEHEPVANLTVDVTSGTAYDRSGRRVRIGSEQNVNIALDEDGVSTTVPLAGDERWVSVFVEFDRELDDERTDGSDQQVFFIRNESYRFVVRQGAAADIGLATRPGLDDDLVLLCDVHLINGQLSVLEADISTTRRQVATVYTADLIGFNEAEFEVLDAGDDLQAAMVIVDAHLDNTGTKHPASAITTAATGWLGAADAQAMFAEIVTDLALQAGTPGADRIGAAAYSWLSAGTLQAMIQEIVDDLAQQGAGVDGALRIGVDDIDDGGGTFGDLVAGTLRSQLIAISAKFATVWDNNILWSLVRNEAFGSAEAPILCTAGGTQIGNLANGGVYIPPAMLIAFGRITGGAGQWYMLPTTDLKVRWNFHDLGGGFSETRVVVENSTGVDYDVYATAWIMASLGASRG